ncbi:unnamed protein product [Boreogadus saida]
MLSVTERFRGGDCSPSWKKTGMARIVSVSVPFGLTGKHLHRDMSDIEEEYEEEGEGKCFSSRASITSAGLNDVRSPQIYAGARRTFCSHFLQDAGEHAVRAVVPDIVYASI